MTSPRDALPTATSNLPFQGVELVPFRVLVILGTRPEAVKLCPLICELRRTCYQSHLQTFVCVTAQHRSMLDQVLRAFELRPDCDLDLMQAGQTLSSFTSRTIAGLEPVMVRVRPHIAIVQGDTATTLCGALSAFYHQVPIAHVEAGLRTFDFLSPFPEEMNRVVTGRIAAVHFAATAQAARNLRSEGVCDAAIAITGNTGIDAVLAVAERLRLGELVADCPERLPAGAAGKKLLVVTAHRRESLGEGLENICKAIKTLSERNDVHVVWPVHRNPAVRETIARVLGESSAVTRIEPLDYVPFVDLMRRAYLLLTDSGGIQEEGPSLGKPVLVLREKTERPEAVEAGTAKLVGVNQSRIVEEAVRLLDDPEEYQRMARLHNPYGDGSASRRIASRLIEFLQERYGARTGAATA